MTEPEEERPPLPAGWTWRRVGEVTINPGQIDPSKSPSQAFWYLDITSVDNERGIIATTRSISGRDAPSRARKVVRAGDVVFSNVRPALRNTAIVRQEDRIDVCTTGFTVLRPTDRIRAEWLWLYLRTKSFVDGLVSAETGSMYPAVTDGMVRDQLIPVPSAHEQQQILNALIPMLAGVAAERARLERAQRNGARARKSLLAAAFRGSLVGHGGREIQCPDDDYLPEIPGHWQWETTSSVVPTTAPISYGIVLPGPEYVGGVPYIRQQDIEGGRVVTGALRHTTPEIAASHARSKLAPGDVLLCIIRHLRVAIVPQELEGANITQGTVRIRPSARVEGRYLYYWLGGPNAQSWMQSRYTGTDMPRINVETARSVPVPLPPLDEQREIVLRLDAAFAVLDDLDVRVTRALRQCDRLRESLLQRAFRGELLPPADLRGADRMDSIPAANGGETMAHPPDPRRHRFGGPWTETKLDILKKYLAAYTTALKKQPFSKLYIDAFAGTGYREQRQEPSAQLDFPDLADEGAQGLRDGSAVYALRTEPAFDRYVFIERNPKRCAALKQLCAEFPDRADAIEVREAEANEAIRALCAEPWRNRRAVLFLDPYGMQVAWQTIEAVAATKAIDLWLLFPLGIGVNRLLTRSGEIPEDWRRRLDALLGTADWFDAFYQVKPAPTLFDPEAMQVEKASVEVIGRYFVERLKTIFAGVAEPRVLRNASNNPMYLLCFAAANEKGAKVALRIAEHLLKET